MTHINVFIMRILEYIQKSKRQYTFREVEMNCGIKVSAIINTLRKNPKVKIQNDKISYISEFSINSRDQLKKVLEQQNGEGIEIERLDDGNGCVSGLIFTEEELKEKAKIKEKVLKKKFNPEKDGVCKIDDDFIVLADLDGSQVVFSHDKSNKIDISPEIISLWHSIKVPEYLDIIDELKKSGATTSDILFANSNNSNKNGINSNKHRGGSKKKKRVTRRNIKITNTHIKGLDLENMEDILD